MKQIALEGDVAWRTLKKALATMLALCIGCGRIEKHFNYISRGLDGKATPAATLENLQFAYDHNAELRKRSDENIWIPWDAPFMQPHRRHLMATWKRRHSSVPIVKWRQKANLIGKETNWLRAAAAHDDLNRQMDYLDEAIIEVLSEFDGWVQQQIDRRGASEQSDQLVPSDGAGTPRFREVPQPCCGSSSRMTRRLPFRNGTPPK